MPTRRAKGIRFLSVDISGLWNCITLSPLVGWKRRNLLTSHSHDCLGSGDAVVHISRFCRDETYYGGDDQVFVELSNLLKQNTSCDRFHAVFKGSGLKKKRPAQEVRRECGRFSKPKAFSSQDRSFSWTHRTSVTHFCIKLKKTETRPRISHRAICSHFGQIGFRCCGFFLRERLTPCCRPFFTFANFL